MENAINEPVKKNYDFIDHIRCIAMIGIVVEHTVGSEPPLPGSTNYPIFLFVIQFFKFGTIIFFLLSGFLISEKFTDYTPGQYLKRRFSSTFGPWLLWSIVYLVCFIANLWVKQRMYHDNDHRLTFNAIVDEINIIYLHTNYWFIINFMVSITILLIFRKYLYNLLFGAILFGFTLFYCVNIYFEWINPTHTMAIFGFVFFLWLGAQMRKHWLIIQNQITLLPYPFLFFIMAITFGLATYEITLLSHRGSFDPLNTLRFSNILFSLAAFALLLKIGVIKSLNFLRPRQTTYGVYLIHFILVVFLVPEILRPLHINIQELAPLTYVFVKLGAFLTVYGITIILVLLISNTTFKKIIGN